MALLFLALFVSGSVCLDIVMDSVVGPGIMLSGTVFQALRWWGEVLMQYCHL